MGLQPLGEKAQAAVDAFFHQRDQELLATLRQQIAEEERRSGLKAATGIQQDQLLDRLIELGLDRQAIAALALVPLVEVAWADHKMDQREHDAIMNAAEDAGLDATGPGYQLLETWIKQRPAPELLAVWKEYSAAVAAALTDVELAALRDDVLHRARRVAEAAGGLLGLGNKVSPKERQLLDELRAAFAKPSA